MSRLRRWLVMAILCFSGGIIFMLPFLREVYYVPMQEALGYREIEVCGRCGGAVRVACGYGQAAPPSEGFRKAEREKNEACNTAQNQSALSGGLNSTVNAARVPITKISQRSSLKSPTEG